MPFALGLLIKVSFELSVVAIDDLLSPLVYNSKGFHPAPLGLFMNRPINDQFQEAPVCYVLTPYNASFSFYF